MIGPKVQIINREISWLHFNARVLQEANDERTPLIERIKFLGIFSNNRDEFFRVRVATLNRLQHLPRNRPDIKPLFDPAAILEEVKHMVREQEQLFHETYLKIVGKLAGEGIFIINETQLDNEQGLYVRKFFERSVRQFLFPIMLRSFHNITSIRDGSIYLAVDLQKTTGKIREDIALIKVPSKTLSRFLILPEKNGYKYIILLDDVIRYCLSDIFSVFGYDRFSAYTIKITRDAELDIDNDVSRSFIELISESLKKRKRGVPVRFVYDGNMPEQLLEKITRKLKISEEDNIRSGGRYHNFKDFMSFPSIGPDHLFFPPFPPLMHPDLPPNRSILGAVHKKDIMIHFPYQSFHHILDLLREASIDPNVTSIKMTFYRTARYSNAINALVNAARNGKRVTVFLEIQARFDEEANIILAGKLQDEGVRIIPTIPNFKVHAKLISITRKENGENVYYANISTGNFNESTAQVYADESLLTARQEITEEVERVFDLFEERYVQPEFSHLIVAPFSFRSFSERMLDNEIRNARAGREAWAIIKINSLVDRKIAAKLYQASRAGVKLTMIIRGISVLIPGKKGLSENIEVISIVDRFLEHSRVLVFCNGGNPRYFIGSADWMPRNLDHRIEVVTPVYDPDIRRELWDMLQIQLRDNCKARKTTGDDINCYLTDGKPEKHRAQFELYDYFKEKLIRQED
ncbi:MAG: polyphosphate kinase 1 [Bacteroidales bacterium]|nr:polyphosphate kinase 1 [Bacteroidales bacterium]